MRRIELASLREAPVDQLWAILRDPRIARHMPLHDPSISVSWVEQWVESKMSQWPDESMGPWAIYLDGTLAGWGGYQPDDGVAELAVVLKPDSWGAGQEIVSAINVRWTEVGNSLPRRFYLPKSRRVLHLAKRFSFHKVGETSLGDTTFDVYELLDPS
jgi:hypothetical protein